MEDNAKYAACNKKRQKQPEVCHTTTILLQLCHERVEITLADKGHASPLNKECYVQSEMQQP